MNVSPGGIPKRPVGRALLTPFGVEGDRHNHPGIHGGPDKAVLIVAIEIIEQLRAKGYPVFNGALGENLTTSGLDCRAWRTGQRYQAGEAVIELTSIRTPCRTLDVYGPAIKSEIYDARFRAGDTAAPLWGASGFYGAVVRSGQVSAGAPISLLSINA